MSKSQVEIVENAGHLAADLQSGPAASKTAFLAVVSTFMSDPTGDLDRLRRTMTLLEKGSGGHLKRGGGFGEQVRVVIREVTRLLERRKWEAKELKSLFGWTARLLLVRAESKQGGGSKSTDAKEKRPPAPVVPPSAKNRKVPETVPKKSPPQQIAPPKSSEEKLRDRIRPIGFHNADREVPRLLDELTGEEQQLAAQAIVNHLDRRKLREKGRRDKVWVLRLFEIVGSGN